jgi:hypothetical protein
MLRIPTLTVCGVLLAAAISKSLFAATTNEVDISSIAAKAAAGAEEAIVDGWRFRGLKTYSESCIKFDTLSDALISKNYQSPIVAIVYSVRCSSLEPTRFLSVVIGEDGETLGRIPVVSAKDKLEEGVFLIPEEAQVKKISLLLNGSGTTGVWGLGRLAIVTSDGAEAPEGLSTERIGSTRAILSWINSFSTVSNSVSIIRLSDSLEGAGAVFECDFSLFSAGGNTKDHTSLIPEMYPGLSGERIYAPKDTTGICQISSGTAYGVLSIAGCEDYSGVSLHIRLKRYPEDYAKTELRWTDGIQTNRVAEISLGDEFTDEVIDVSSVPHGATLLICEDSAKGKRRVLIDSLSLVRKGAYRVLESETKSLVRGKGRVVVSTAGMNFKNLIPSSRYRVTVKSFASSGGSSGESQIEFITDESKPFAVVVR